MKKVKTIQRFLKKEYGPKKLSLPKSLEFLSDVNFHAIIEDESSGRVIRTIEIKPTTLKRLVEDLNNCLDYLIESDDLIKKSRSENRRLKSENKKLRENIERYRALEQDLSNAKERNKQLAIELQSKELVASQVEALEKEREDLLCLIENKNIEIKNLSEELTCSFDEDLEIKNIELQARIDSLEKIIDDFEIFSLRKNKNAFFGSDMKIVNPKPYRG
ncbi:hypothetical protein [Alishewanella sp. SMS8]|uniref:hypothetical protein n=1 Tax=Alishewanella sp. SMS8 TaxID=2994676 RepID=UPI002741A537|nr:hypothetical protein [Alishewanella sp. SMS8]MDP5459600.1 hypothetical protein [Alishewanella sp. SMS8]